MKYSFKLHKYYDEKAKKSKEVPLLNIDNQDQYGDFFLTEISNLNDDYLLEIEDLLSQVLNGVLMEYSFGYEVYVIECDKEKCQVKNSFEGWKTEAEIPTIEIYELIRDWRSYKLEWSNNQ